MNYPANVFHHIVRVGEVNTRNCILLDLSVHCCILLVGEEDEWPEADENKVIVMKLKVRCKRNPKAPEGATTPADLYTDAHGEYRLISFISHCVISS